MMSNNQHKVDCCYTNHYIDNHCANGFMIEQEKCIQYSEIHQKQMLLKIFELTFKWLYGTLYNFYYAKKGYINGEIQVSV